MANEIKEYDTNTVYELLLSKVKADFEWNSRKGADRAGDADSEKDGTSFSSLMSSIDQQGQREPVLVRVLKGGSFELVYGFRRFAALKALAEKNGTKDATVRAYVKVLNDLEARKENIRENVAREQLTPADLTKSLVDLRKQYDKSKAKFTITALADEIGINRPYASRIFNVADHTKPELLQAWYDQTSPIGFERMESVAKAPLDKQEEVFAEKTKTGGRGNKSADAWMERAINKCETAGAFLGKLEGLNLISTENLDFKENLTAVIGEINKDATDEQKKDLVHALSEAFTEAVKIARNPPEEEEKPKKGKKAKKGETDAEAAN